MCFLSLPPWEHGKCTYAAVRKARASLLEVRALFQQGLVRGEHRPRLGPDGQRHHRALEVVDKRRAGLDLLFAGKGELALVLVVVPAIVLLVVVVVVIVRFVAALDHLDVTAGVGGRDVLAGLELGGHDGYVDGQ